MADDATNTSTEDGNDTSGATSAAGDEFKPITSQDDLNRVIADRVNREKAKFADYKDLKAKAARLDEIEQANKSEADKVAERIAAAEARAQVAELRSIRFEIATEFALTTEAAKALEHVTSEDGMREIAKVLADKAAQTKKNGNHVAREGNTQSTGTQGDEREFVRNLFGQAD